MIELDSEATVEINPVGEEQTKVIVVDSFANNVDALKNSACEVSGYTPDGKTSYPGVRAILPDEYVDLVVQFSVPLLRREFGIPDSVTFNVTMAYFSLLTVAEKDLSVPQRLPHFDTTKKHYYAVLHYLNDGDFGGTGFFRHVPTGFEKVDNGRKDLYKQSVLSFMAVRGVPDPAYIGESSAQFKCYSKVEYKSNRLVIYPGNLLHCGLLSESQDVCEDPRKGRLTASIFIDFDAE